MGGTAAITGSASGIGAAVKARFERDGFATVGIDVRRADVQADLATAAGRGQAVAALLERLGGALDRLVLCAGLGTSTRPPSRVAKVNYFGVVDLLDALLPALARGRAPNAVVICSNSAQMAPLDDHPYVRALLDHDEEEAARLVDAEGSGVLAYLGSKHALGRAVRRRAAEWGKLGVRLNAVCPGPVDTPLLRADIDDPGTRASIESLPIPLRRRGQPDEIAALVAFLSGPDASWIHGSIVYIDGGTDAQIRPDRY
jgi:NAD(P)-dependent dehydrogenase (short-subunit alcohol dehydrogenase family)